MTLDLDQVPRLQHGLFSFKLSLPCTEYLLATYGRTIDREGLLCLATSTAQVAQQELVLDHFIKAKEIYPVGLVPKPCVTVSQEIG
jgi:hypothetical protein